MAAVIIALVAFVASEEPTPMSVPACLGEHLARRAVAGDEAAVMPLETRCTKGCAGACVLIGELYRDGAAGLARDAGQMSRAFEKACGLKSYDGCVLYRRAMADGKVDEDPAVNVAQLRARCAGGKGEVAACYGASVVAVHRFPESDVENAHAGLAKACATKPTPSMCSGALFDDLMHNLEKQMDCRTAKGDACLFFSYVWLHQPGGPTPAQRALLARDCRRGIAGACTGSP